MEELFQNNEFFQGGLMLAILGGIIAALRFLPIELWRIIQRRIAPMLYVRDDTLVNWISDWLQETENRSSQWWMGQVVNRGDAQGRILLKPGQGLHIVRRFGIRFLVWSNLEDNGIAGKIQTITIRCYGRSAEPLKRLLDEVGKLAKEREEGKNVTFINNVWGDWRQLKLGTPRQLDTVFLANGQLEEINNDIKRFLDAKEEYFRKGVPYRRGYLLEGSPGNGKSTIVQGLSTEHRLPIYFLSLADLEFSDTKLANAVGAVPKHAILLLEDAEKIDFSKSGVTMTGLLNSIDGALASEGRVLIVTANDKNKLDVAFKREGRMDRTWKIENPDSDSIRKMAVLFFPDENESDLDKFARCLALNNWSMAKVQGHLQRCDSLTIPGLKEVGAIVN